MGATIARRFGWLSALVLVAGSAAAGDDPAAPSTVTIHARGIRLDDALREMRKQTGNAVARTPGFAANPAIDLDLEAVPFLRALDSVAAKAGARVSPYLGDGSIGVEAGGGDVPAAPVEYAGPFRVELKSVTLVRDFELGMSAANVAFRVSWEPRVRPLLLSIKSSGVEARDDRGRASTPLVAMESNDVAVDPENPAVELDATLTAPERSALKLSSLRLAAGAIVPADLKTFRFPRLDEKRTLREGGLAATLSPVEVDEQVWRFNVVLEYPDGGPGFESFRQGLFDNRVLLEKADGSKFEHNGGFSTTGGGERLEFEYLFNDVPGDPKDYRLVYEAPARFAAIPIDVAFKDVPLP